MLIDPATEQPLGDYPWHTDQQVIARLIQAQIAYGQWRQTALPSAPG